LLVAALALLAGEGCSRQRSKQLAPASSVSKTVAPDASTAAPEVLPPQYRVFHVFPKETNIWSVGERLVACESRCVFEWAKDPVPRTWLVSAAGVELDASLLPQVKHIDRPVIRYWGTYPKDLYALIEVDHDSSDQRDLAFRYLGPRPAKHFVSSFPPGDSSFGAFVPRAFARMVDSLGALRLSNGATLVRSIDNREDDSRSLFWISPTGSVKRLDLQLPAMQPPLGTIRFRAADRMGPPDLADGRN
jgi:hypothetical protein